MIDSQTKQRIIDTATILDVVSDFVSLRRSGVNYVGLCPFHNDRMPSFHVSPSKNICKCFSCGEGGSPVHFIMKHEQLGYNDALRYLAKKYHIDIVEREETDEEKQAASERQSLFILNEYAQKFFVEQLNQTEEGRTVALAYFRERGIRPDIIEKFGLGYSPDLRDVFTKRALSDSYSLERLTAVGLSLTYEDKPPIDRFRGRVIFPVRNTSGQYVAFGGRILGKSDKIAKYVNSPESAIYSKSKELYGLYWAKQAISKADKCYLVEGYTDVLSMHQAGIENVVASSGTALTVQQIRLIRRFTEHITVLYDGDEAGVKAALRGIDLLLEEGLNIKVVLLPQGEDPDSYARQHSAEELLSFLNAEETDFIHFKINLYREEMTRDPLKRAELIKDILKSIALIPDTIRRTVLVQSSAIELNMDEQLLASEVNRLRAQGVGTNRGMVYRDPELSKPQASVVDVFTSLSPTSSASDSTSELSLQPYEPYRYELSLINLLIQKGSTSVLALVENEQNELVYTECILANYVQEELSLDGLLYELSPVCSDVLREITEICIPQSLESSDYFINHESEVIRRFATELLSMQIRHGYIDDNPDDEKSARLSQRLANAITPEEKQAVLRDLEDLETDIRHKRMISEGEKALWELDQYRMAIVLRNIDRIQQQLIEAERVGDLEQIRNLIRELQEENIFKQELAQTLGERTIKA